METLIESVSKHNYRKFKSLTSLGALEILLLLHSNNALSFSQIYEMLCNIEIHFISLKTTKKVIKMLLRYRFISRKKLLGSHAYHISEEGKRILEWMIESPLDILHKVAICDKCLSVYEVYDAKEKCVLCKGASLLNGFLFKEFFIESDGSHFFSLAHLRKLPAEDVALQRSAIRLFILRYLHWHKEAGVEQIMKTHLISDLEKHYGKYDVAFIDNIMGDMVKVGEIRFRQSNWITTDLSPEDLIVRFAMKCVRCGESNIELSPLVKDPIQIKPEIYLPSHYVCSNNPHHIVYSECIASLEVYRQREPTCYVCKAQLKSIDYKTEMELTKKLFSF